MEDITFGYNEAVTMNTKYECDGEHFRNLFIDLQPNHFAFVSIALFSRGEFKITAMKCGQTVAI